MVPPSVVGDEALLGVVILEHLGLVLNPFDRTLRPKRAMLAGARRRNEQEGRVRRAVANPSTISR